MAKKETDTVEQPEKKDRKVQEHAFPSFDRETKAKEMIVVARERAAAIERKAYEEGFSKGEGAGFEMGKAQAMPSVEAIAKLVEQLSQTAEQTLAAMEKEIVRLVLAIAERVMRTIIAEDHTVVQRVIKAALQEVRNLWEVTIKVSPSEYEFLQENKEQWLRIEELQNVTLVPDPAIEPGGCIVQTPKGFVDATLKEALARVAQIGE